MFVLRSKKYDLILSYDPCDLFRYFGVKEMHGLSFRDCKMYNNTTTDAYIAGLTNISPIDEKLFVFINLSRCTDDIHTTGLVMHEMNHLFWALNYDKLKQKEEEIISSAEEETYKVLKFIKKIKDREEDK